MQLNILKNKTVNHWDSLLWDFQSTPFFHYFRMDQLTKSIQKRKISSPEKGRWDFYRHIIDICKSDPPPLPANHCHGSQIISEWIFKLRRTESIANVPENFWKHSTENKTIFVFVNDSNAGQDVLIRAYFEQFRSAQEANIHWKSPNDAVHVAVEMCHPDICQGMAQCLWKLRAVKILTRLMTQN